MINMTQPKLYSRGNKLWLNFSLDGKYIRKSLNLEDNKVNKKIALILKIMIVRIFLK